ncbi:MAG: ACT domain-containing protein [Oscillochloridaceae bacterium umkhey_bin13]
MSKPIPIRDLATLLATLNPQRQPGVFVFTSIPFGAGWPYDPSQIIASIHEPEGLSLIMPEAAAQQAGLSILARCAWITLNVTSDLAAVGLTAAVASQLRDHGLSCNIVAGAFHDHLFVPLADAEQALNALQDLQAQAQRDQHPT